MATPQKKATPKSLTKRGTSKTAPKAVSPYEIPGAPPLTSLELEDAERWQKDGLNPQDIRERIARNRNMGHLYENICHMTIQELKDKILSRELSASHALLDPSEGSLGSMLYKTLECKFANISGIVGNYPEFQEADRLHLWVALDSLLPGPNLLLSLRQRVATCVSLSLAETYVWSTLEKRLVETLTNMEKFPLESAAGIMEIHVEYFESIAKDLVDIMRRYYEGAHSSAPTVTAGTTPYHVVLPPTPTPQRTDTTLIHDFLSGERDEEVIAELEKRSKGAPFIACKGLPSKGDYDEVLSLELLKNARKSIQNPLRILDANIYTVSQLDLKNRVRHECPLCYGVPLVRGVCPRCDHDFNPLTLNQRRHIRVGLMALSTPYAGQTPSSVEFLVNSFKSIKDVRDLLEESHNTKRFDTLDQELTALGRSPTLLIVDDPIVFEDHHKEILKSVDAFHRQNGGK